MVLRRISPLRIVVALVALVLLVPTLMVIPMSFTAGSTFEFPPKGLSLRWYENFFSDPAWRDALLNSLWIGLLVTVVATVLGTASAYGLSRTRGAGRAAVRGLHMAPQIVPNIVVAVAIYAIFLRWGLTGTTLGFVLAHVCLALPFVLVAVTASLEGLDRRLEHAAASLGANPWQTFFRVTLPAIRPGVLSGAVFAFATSVRRGRRLAVPAQPGAADAAGPDVRRGHGRDRPDDRGRVEPDRRRDDDRDRDPGAAAPA